MVTCLNKITTLGNVIYIFLVLAPYQEIRYFQRGDFHVWHF
ncbi:hypothetical protein APTSU1_000326500 [Apodemus speciosus]|uniref:Uncharacterized protein n=1 Tax=Apodemus speciosus TaxID=105296 RepID=A0ABQ0EMJ6_APOSI